MDGSLTYELGEAVLAIAAFVASLWLARQAALRAPRKWEWPAGIAVFLGAMFILSTLAKSIG